MVCPFLFHSGKIGKPGWKRPEYIVGSIILYNHKKWRVIYANEREIGLSDKSTALRKDFFVPEVTKTIPTEELSTVEVLHKQR